MNKLTKLNALVKSSHILNQQMYVLLSPVDGWLIMPVITDSGLLIHCRINGGGDGYDAELYVFDGTPEFNDFGSYEAEADSIINAVNKWLKQEA